MYMLQAMLCDCGAPYRGDALHTGGSSNSTLMAYRVNAAAARPRARKRSPVQL